MPSILKTEAIALALRPFSAHSRIVTWLSPEYGRVTTIIKGACRPKSFFLGQIDIGYRNELLFYAKDGGGLHYIRETTPLDVRYGLRTNPGAATAVGYLCWLVAQTVQPMQDASAPYEALDSSISAIAHGEPPMRRIVSFEFKLLDALGLSPGFDDDSPAFEPRMTLSPALRKALGEVQKSAIAGTPFPELPRSLMLGVRRFLAIFLAHNLEIQLKQRNIAFSMLNRLVGRAGIEPATP